MLDLPASDRPRERLLRQGVGSLQDAELLALLLGTGGPGRSALATAHDLLARFRDLRRMAAAGTGELSAVPGLGFASACRVKAALALAGRLGERPIARGDEIREPEVVAERTGRPLLALDREVFVGVLLDAKHRALCELTLAEGGACSIELLPRDVFTAIVREGAAAVIFVHNHPSGDPAPSDPDRDLTARLISAGALIGVRVLDHVIVAQNGFYSFKRNSGLKGGVL